MKYGNSKDRHYDGIGFCVSGVAAEYGSFGVLKLFKELFVGDATQYRKMCWEANIYDWARKGKKPLETLRWLIDNEIPDQERILRHVEKDAELYLQLYGDVPTSL